MNTRHPASETFSFFILIKKGCWFFVPALIWFIAAPFVLVYFRDGAIYRFINGHYNTALDTLLPVITVLGTGFFVVMGAALLLLFPKFRNRQFVLAAALCNIIPALAAQSLKNIFNAPRPLQYLNHASWIHYVEGQPLQYQLSFPSGHSTAGFALCCFFTLLLQEKHRYWGLLFFLIALAVGYSRIYLSQHFFSDVYAGSLIGTLGCLLTYWLLSWKRRKRRII